MAQGDGNKDVASNAESGDGAEQADNQSDGSQEFGADGQKGQRHGDVHTLGKETHGAGESIAAEPAESFLRAVGEKEQAEDQAKNGHNGIVGGVDELAEHEHASLSLERKMGFHETEMLHRFRRLEDSKAADRGICGASEVGKIFETKFLQAHARARRR